MDSMGMKAHPAMVGKRGLEIGIVGELLILFDGIYVLTANSVLAPSVGGASIVGWGEIVLVILMLLGEYFYKGHPVAVAWTVGALALIAILFDGGFFYVGAFIALIGAILTGYKK